MKNLFIRIHLISVFFLLAHSARAQKTIAADSLKTVIDGNLFPFSTLLPGDTILLLPGIRPFIILKNINGSPENPIIISNGQGEVEINSDHYFGISIRRSTHIKLSGKGSAPIKYGIRIFNKVGSGLSIGDYTSFVEVEGVEVGFSQYSGIVAKTEPFCGFLRSSFIQENTSIHDCYVHHSGTEGMYIGSSFYNGQVIQCSGIAVTVLPPLLRNVEVYNNIVEYTGWDGIQVSSAINTRIHHNLIRYDSQSKTDWQMTGIILGEGSTGEIYNNEIKDGEGSGIFTNGLGDIYIYNNKILRPGKNNNLSSGKYGMYIDEKSAISGMYFYIFNNLILNARTEGIRFLSYQGKKRNFIVNNVILKTEISPGNFEEGYINIVGEKISVGSNFATTDLNLLRFHDIDKDDYRVGAGSLLIDAGQLLPFKNLLKDCEDQTRLQGTAIDIGPHESTFEREGNSNSTTQDIAYPNPVTGADKTTINFQNPVEGWIEFILVDHTGKKIKFLDRTYYTVGSQYKIIQTSELKCGLNFIQIRKRMENSIVRISVMDP
ncbi:MAG: right-handed parallel beta-helix repeat-containing protein [Bacteroidetes bacterium]|nr:right-handed parallel beta-helix repeat-containing protein [Bacteroidota bacterium]